MFSFKARTAVVIIVAFSLVPGALAQQTATTAPTPQATAPRAPDYVEHTGFKGKVFDVKHREPRTLWGPLMSLGSGFKGAEIRYSDEFRTITVRDFPENIAAIEEALKRLDTPQAAQPDIELRMYVLIASNVEGVVNQYPTDLGDVVKQMQAMLSYKSYSNVATVVQRVRAGSRNVGMDGTAEIPAKILEMERPQSATYEFRVQDLTLATDSSAAYTVRLGDTGFSLHGSDRVGQANIRTDINLRNGERVVVGTATLGNKGLILVLSARTIK